MIRIPIGNEKSMRVEVRSVSPDANPYMVMYAVFKTGLDGETAKIKNLRQAERYLPDNIYTALENFRDAKWTTTMLGDDVKGRYADLKRGAAVWNVVAAPELSLELKTWCFAIVGCVGYRGYYDQAGADALATPLRGEGLDVAVYPVPAYSTLGRLPQTGWLADPLLNTFIGYPEGELARLVFHELAHQVAFAPGDTLFNESFASTVEKIGAERWMSQRASAEARAEYAEGEARRQDFRMLTDRYRGEFAALYASAESDAAKREAKAGLLTRLRADYAAMKATRWHGYAGYDGWFGRANNAAFGVLASYTALVPAFERLFEREGSDFARFYAAVKRIAALPPEQRRAALAA